jgi:ATP-dependent Lon protease
MFFQRRAEEKAPPLPSAPSASDLDILRERLEKTELPAQVREAGLRELERLTKTDPSAAEYAIGLNYLDFLLSLPWTAATQDTLDLKLAESTLSGRHYGLGQVKERVLEHLATRALRGAREYHILVVDDEDIARANLEYVLKKEGYQVRSAANGLEALEELRRWEFDLLITDLKMEKLDGMQLIEQVKKISPQTQAVMVTGFATVNSAVQAMRQGAVYYLAKPVNLAELRQTVADIAKYKSAAAPSRSPVLCFVGPPGTGKTSVGQAVAEALGRKFHRLSLAGLRDESELRGHRRTYVGALPGRIVQSLARLKVRNPVFMLDEIDKVGKDFRGDPEAVFLEILDPEQNAQFVDYFLDVPFDLSQVLFIATANDVSKMSAPLLDRLEVVQFQGYSEREKVEIALRHIIPRQLREHGLTHPYPCFSQDAALTVVSDYTREAGVRGLEREIAKVCRKLAKLRLEENEKNGEPQAGAAPVIDSKTVESLLGPKRYPREAAAGPGRVGVATGLVYSEQGGQILFVEATRMKGAGALLLTGSLGEILRESAQTALSFVRSHAQSLGLDPDIFLGQDVHVHIPAGAIPKEGPSAGLTLALALASLFLGKPLRRDVAVTGETTLNGDLLPVGGIREKILAAARSGVTRVILPTRNKPDVEALEEDDKAGLEIVLVEKVTEALEFALEG